MDRFACSDTAGDYSFTNCKWQSCTSSSTGAAISLSQSSSSLNIIFCTFSSCSACSGGGAVYVSSLPSVFIRYSFLNSCRLSKDGSYAGGVYASSITKCVRIDDTSFIRNEGDGHASALLMDNSNSNTVSDTLKYQRTAISNCRFVSCRMTRYDGTVYLITLSIQSISNCLFSNNYAKRWAGAVRLHVDTLHFDEKGNALPYFLFDFFNNNEATNIDNGSPSEQSQAGQNIYLTSINNIVSNGDKCFASCFSANDRYGIVRYYPYTDQTARYPNNWLPHAAN